MKDKNYSLSVRFAEKQRSQEKNVLSPPKDDDDAYYSRPTNGDDEDLVPKQVSPWQLRQMSQA